MAIVLTWRQMNGLGTAFHLTADPHQPAPEVDLGLNSVLSFYFLGVFLFLATSLDAWISVYSVILSE